MFSYLEAGVSNQVDMSSHPESVLVCQLLQEGMKGKAIFLFKKKCGVS